MSTCFQAGELGDGESAGEADTASANDRDGEAVEAGAAGEAGEAGAAAGAADAGDEASPVAVRRPEWSTSLATSTVGAATTITTASTTSGASIRRRTDLCASSTIS